MARTKKNSNGSSAATVGFEQKLWAATGAFRNNMDAAVYKHAVSALQRVLTSVEQSLTLGALRDALLTKRISGEIRIKDFQHSVAMTNLTCPKRPTTECNSN